MFRLATDVARTHPFVGHRVFCFDQRGFRRRLNRIHRNRRVSSGVVIVVVVAADDDDYYYYCVSTAPTDFRLEAGCLPAAENGEPEDSAHEGDGFPFTLLAVLVVPLRSTKIVGGLPFNEWEAPARTQQPD